MAGISIAVDSTNCSVQTTASWEVVVSLSFSLYNTANEHKKGRMLTRWTVIIALLVTVAVSAAVWVFAPKENTTVWRSSVILTLALCYIMWAITYLGKYKNEENN